MKKRLLCTLTSMVLLTALAVPAAASAGDFQLTNGNTGLGGYTGSGGDVEIPAGLGIQTIWNAFQGNTDITSVTIPEGVQELQLSAFSGCTGLERVELPHSLRSISHGAFENCTSLKEIVIPQGVRELGRGVFAGCSSLERVVLPAGLEFIDDKAFAGCSSLREIELPQSLKKLGSWVFRDCPALEHMSIPASVTELGIELFEGDTALPEVIIGGRTIRIGEGEKKDYTFMAPADQLERVFVIEDNAKVYQDQPMDRVLTRYLGQGGDVVVPEGVKGLGSGVFSHRTDITSITLPESLERIGSDAFSGCTGLTELRIPDGVSYLGADVISGTGLTELDLPTGLTELDKFALGGCPTLRKITFHSPMPSLRDGPLKNMKYLFGGDRALEEVVNLPNRELQARWDANRAQMEQWVNPADFLKPQSQRITDLAAGIGSSLTNDRDRALEIFYWVTAHVDYDWDYFNGVKAYTASAPEEVLDSGLAVCDGYARLTQALLQAKGIPAMYVTGIADGVASGPHAWVEAYVDGRWILIDPTFGDNFFGVDYFDPILLSFSCDHELRSRPTAAEEDIPSGWAREETGDAISAGLVPYELQGSYRENITREDFCRLMVQLIGRHTGLTAEQYVQEKGLSLTAPFTDTDSPAVLAAYALGVVNGTTPTTFNPGGSITRQEAAAMLARTARLLELPAGTPETFADAGALAPWAAESVALVSGLSDPTTGRKVMGGVGGGSFDPTGSYTREQAVLTALRLFRCAD